MDVNAPQAHFSLYSAKLSKTLATFDWSPVEELGRDLLRCWSKGNQVFICGNGGSAANAVHVANDLLYPVSKKLGSGLRAHALSVNTAAVTCLANDEGYSEVFAYQLAVMARRGDLLIVLSGSGNSPNILRVLEEARARGVKSFAILGFSGGKAKALADTPIHFAIDDMQIAEDAQMIVCHMVSQWLFKQRDTVAPAFQ